MPPTDISATTLERPEQPTLHLGMVLFIISEAFLFGSLFFTYYYLRSHTATWPPEGVELDMRLALINTAILLSSSLTMHWATLSARQGRRRQVELGLLATFALGGTFLVVTFWEWFHESFQPWSHAYGSIFFTLTGFHALHVFIGLLLLLILFVRTRRARLSLSHPVVLEVGGLYWHFVDFIWIFVFSTLFLVH